ncbi:hypothetical protein [Herbaspirillum sp. NPDC087042]|uniref:hypothetical protein n=1 Tax=Herbaspirillum sp. NPDC087042 TaxID=3364004 RepID=UPI00380A3A13
MKITKRPVLILLAAVSLISNIAFAAPTTIIEFSGDTIYPESVSWSNQQNRFFVGSVRHGGIGTVDMNGQYKPFAQDGALPSTFGINIDDTHQKVWVTIDDLGTGASSSAETQGKLAAVAVFDSKTGKKLAYYDMHSIGPGPRLANDVAVDKDGNAYVTDSYAHVVYRIDQAGKLSIFASSPLFETGEMFGLNGIAVHPDGYLLVGAWNSGELFRIALDDPKNITKLRIGETLKGMDGITLLDAQNLIATINVGKPRAVRLQSNDGWKTAQIAETMPAASTFPSSATRAGNDVWVLNTRLDTLIDPKAEKVNSFILQSFKESAKE